MEERTGINLSSFFNILKKRTDRVNNAHKNHMEYQALYKLAQAKVSKLEKKIEDDKSLLETSDETKKIELNNHIAKCQNKVDRLNKAVISTYQRDIAFFISVTHESECSLRALKKPNENDNPNSKSSTKPTAPGQRAPS